MNPEMMSWPLFIITMQTELWEAISTATNHMVLLRGFRMLHMIHPTLAIQTTNLDYTLQLLFIFGINLVMDLEETQVIPTKLLPASHLLAKELCLLEPILLKLLSKLKIHTEGL